MAETLGHEGQLQFWPVDGHNHNGENSSPIEFLPESIGLEHLNEGLISWIVGNGGGEGVTGEGASGGMPVPDLTIQTATVGPGGSVTGSVPWAGLCAVRFTRILMSLETECTITFYHKATFADEDREFRAINCANKFLWEAPWIHYDEDEGKQIHYKIQNTGNQSASFQISLKSGTLSDNMYARFIEALIANGNELTGTVSLAAGNNITITSDPETNTLQINADIPSQIDVVPLSRWALTPVRPTAVTSSVALTSNTLTPLTVLQYGDTGLSKYVNFGAGPQWIQIDTGVVGNWGAIQVCMYYGDRSVWYGIKVDVSADGVTWTTVRDAGNFWFASDGIWIHTPNGIMSRYVRVYANGSSANTNNHVLKIVPYMISNKG